MEMVLLLVLRVGDMECVLLLRLGVRCDHRSLPISPQKNMYMHMYMHMYML